MMFQYSTIFARRELFFPFLYSYCTSTHRISIFLPVSNIRDSNFLLCFYFWKRLCSQFVLQLQCNNATLCHWYFHFSDKEHIYDGRPCLVSELRIWHWRTIYIFLIKSFIVFSMCCESFVEMNLSIVLWCWVYM